MNDLFYCSPLVLFFSQPNVSIRSSGSLVPAQLGERDQEIPDLLRRLLPAPLGLCIRLPAHGAGDHADYRARVDDDEVFFGMFMEFFLRRVRMGY